MSSAAQTEHQLMFSNWALGSSTPVSIVSIQGMQVQGMQSVHLHASLSLDNATRQLGANFRAPTEIWVG